MQRCPCCNARLAAEPLCARCGADLRPALRCEQLAEQWLSLSLQSLNVGQADVAVAAIKRSLSFKQTQAGRLFRDFLVRHLYQALYDCLGQKRWGAARQTVARLQVLLGENETLSRFLAMIEYLSSQKDAGGLSSSPLGSFD
jgi:hypothetical protein